MTIPFTYLIGWKTIDRWYYGVRYARGCHPDDLWTKYYTSSFLVEENRKNYGEPDIIEVRQVFDNLDQARSWEHKLLRRIGAIDSPKWLNQSNGQPPLQLGKKRSPKSIERMRKPKTEEHRLSMIGNQNGKGNKGVSKSDHHRSKLSAAKKGKPGLPKSIEHRAALSVSMKNRVMTEEHRDAIRKSIIEWHCKRKAGIVQW